MWFVNRIGLHDYYNDTIPNKVKKLLWSLVKLLTYEKKPYF